MLTHMTRSNDRLVVDAATAVLDPVVLATSGGAFASPQELGVHGDDHGRDRHEYRAKGRRKQNACRSIKHAGREWDSHSIVSRGPPQILYDFAVRRAR